MSNPLDARQSKSHEGGPSYSIRHRMFRLIWGIVWCILCSWTPAPMHFWRACILRIFGARIGKKVRIYASAKIWYPPNLTVADFASIGPNVDCYCMAQVSVGKHAVVSQNATLCAGSHDIRDPYFQLIVRPIIIGDKAWIAARAFVGPGVIVGEGAVLGAAAVSFKDLRPWDVYIGNPAISIKARPVF